MSTLLIQFRLVYGHLISAPDQPERKQMNHYIREPNKNKQEKLGAYCPNIYTYKDWGLEKYTKLNTIFFLIKSSEIAFIFFTCILPNYMANNIPKEFLKNNLFENMTAGFLLTCQKSLRREISLIRH